MKSPRSLGKSIPDYSRQMTLFVASDQRHQLDVGAAWKERDCWRKKAVSLSEHLTKADATLFAISMLMTDLS
jgi:hypothetical protein